MSLINQVLKDLDKRRGPVNELQASALQGMGLIDGRRFNWYDSLFITAWAIAGLLVIFVSFQLTTRWNNGADREHSTAPAAVVDMAEPLLQAEYDPVPFQEQREVAPLAAAERNEPIAEEAPQTPIASPIASPKEPPPSEPQTPAETAIKPVTVLTPKQKAEHLFAKAQQALSGNQLQNSERLLRQVLDIHPRHNAARSQLAALLLSRHQEVKAEQLLADGLLTDFQQLALARPYAQLLASRGELGQALQVLDRAIGQRQADAETLALRAAILYRMENHSQAITEYRKAVQLQPDRGLWWTGLAIALEQDGQPKQALEAFRRASVLPLNNPLGDYVKQRILLLSDKALNN